MTTTKLTTNAHRLPSGWLVQLCLTAVLLLFGASLNVSADNDRDIITIKSAKVGAADAGGQFKTGAASTEYPGVYVIDVGDVSVEEVTFTVTLSRPLGASAQRAATVTLSYMPMQGVEMTEIFEPGETEKTVELPGFLDAANYGSTGAWSGNLPAMYTIRTTYAETEYDALMIKVNRIPTEDLPECTFATKLEVLQNTQGNDRAFYNCYRWGDYLLMRFFMDTYVKVGADSRYVINARFANHTNLTADDDDYGLAQTHEVELHPINAGSVCSEAWYLYRPSPDEYLHSFDANIGDWTERAVQYPVLEVGPFEVANPAEDAVKYIFYSRADLPEGSANALFPVYLYVDGLMPQFSNVSINKTSFKSGETMVITAKMDNWQFVKRGQADRFRTAFGVTLDDNQTLEPCRYTLDEQTGQVAYYVTAPTVTETKTIHVDFGAAKDDVPGGEKVVISRAESSFTVTVSPETAAGNPVTQMEFVGLPAEGKAVILKKEVFGGGMGEIVRTKEYPLIVDVTPVDATDANEVTYSVTNSGEASAFINSGDSFNGSVLNTGDKNGTITVTASLPSGVSVSRSFSVVVGNGDEEELLAMPEPKNHINHYYIGTVFPQFQFEINNPDNWPVDDAITVNYTHANGTAWTETYSLKTLKRRQTDRGTTTYDLPFSFTEEHPDVTDDSQIGGAVITAQVVMSVPTVEGPKETITCTAMLMSGLKQISFGDYSETTAHWNEYHPVTLTSEVMYLPRMGFTVGYEIPELGIKQTYNSLTDGDDLPEWLELQADDYYYTANITVKQIFDSSVSQYHFYTLAQRSYNPDEVMLREMTTIANLEYIGAEGHILFRINGQDVTGNQTFDNRTAVDDFVQNQLIPAGFLSGGNQYNNSEEVAELFNSASGLFTVYDDVYEGADVTLKLGDDVIQTLQGFKGVFSFYPPSDGQTYNVEVYFPGYNRRYTSTFVCHPFTNIYRIAMEVYPGGAWYDMLDILCYYNNGILREVTLPRPDNYLEMHNYYGYMYIENPNNLCLSGKTRVSSFASNLPPIRLRDFPGLPLKRDSEPTLLRWRDLYSMEEATNFHSASDSDPSKYISQRLYEWEKLSKGNSIVSVVNSKGEIITDATVNYAHADSTMTIQGNAGTTTYSPVNEAYQIETDPTRYMQYIEVVAPGYRPKLSALYIRDYDYNSPENKGKMRRHVVVLDEGDGQVNNLTLETMKRNGNIENDEMQAEVVSDNLLMMDQSETLYYTETADFETVTKHLNGGKFGEEGWSGMKWVHLTGQMACDEEYDASQLTLQSTTFNIQPVMTKILKKNEFSTLSQNYCLFDFDLADQIPDYQTAKPLLKDGDETLAELPSICNYNVDLMALNDANNIDMEPGGFDLTEVDNQAEDNGTDMKDMGKAFDSFSFQMPPVLPFTVNIERNGDYFLVRAVCEKNFIPGGKVMDALDKLGDYQYFEEQFQACMDAVNSGKPADDDDFFDDIPTWPSAFVGIKGYLSGIGHYNPETGKLDINFLDGGITLEASAAAQANVSFGIGSFGMSIDAKIAMTMGLVNTAAQAGDVASTKIDFMFDFQTRLKVCAWAYAGIDLWIAKAVCGVRGGACFDVQSRTYFVSGDEGMKTTLQAQMEAFAEARFLFWKAKKTWPIFKARKEYLTPNDPTNPFHPDYAEPIFEVSQRNVTKGYKKLKRKVIADLGTPIISNVNGMAQPTYLMDGTSLLFNNLKTPKDYNDDRLQVYTNDSKDDLVDTGVEAPMYDFSTARNSYYEMVAFEQLEEAIDGKAIDALTENDLTKTVSEKSRVHLAWREREANEPGAGMAGWNTMNLSDASLGNIAYVNPIVAVPATVGDISKMTKGAALWQQGVAKFNDEGSRYIDGSLMLKRHSKYNSYIEPIEIKRINRRNVPVDYQMAMKDDSVLVMMALQQDVNNQNKGTSLVYVSISPDDKVRERYTMVEGSKPQMVNVGGAILVAYLQQNENGRDIVLNTVNMKGEPTGKLSGALGMNHRMVNDYKLVVQESDDADLRYVALLWSQSDEERTDNADGTSTVNYKNRIYASRLCSDDNKLYFSAPIEVATMPDDVSLVSMDGYLEGLDMKVAYCVANEEDGAAVLENELTFTNAIDHKVTFNPYDMKTNEKFPVKLTVVNNGIDPVTKLEWKMGLIYDYRRVYILPQETAELTVDCYVPDDFDGTFDYYVTAEFGTSDSNALKSRRMGAAARPMRIQQDGTQVDIRQVDMALNILSKRTVDGKTTIVAEVNNASLLPLANDLTVKVGLYDSPLATTKAEGTTEVIVTADDLYDASAEQKNKVKIVSLTVNQPDFDQRLFLRTTPMQGGKVVADVHPTNNVLPVSAVGKYMLGDVNGDRKVTVTDAVGIVRRVSGNTPSGFIEKAADVTHDNNITINDAIGVVNMILKK